MPEEGETNVGHRHHHDHLHQFSSSSSFALPVPPGYRLLRKGIYALLRSFVLCLLAKGALSFLPGFLKSIITSPRNNSSRAKGRAAGTFHHLDMLIKAFGPETRAFAYSIGLFFGIYQVLFEMALKWHFLKKKKRRRSSLMMNEQHASSHMLASIEEDGEKEEVGKAVVSADVIVHRRRAGAIAGFVAGWSLVLMPYDQKLWISQYVSVRAAQCAFQHLRDKHGWKFDKFPLNVLDSLLFVVCSAQVMYAFVIRPDTLPAGYRGFIRKLCPTPEFVLQAIRDFLKAKISSSDSSTSSSTCFDLDAFNNELRSTYNMSDDLLRYSVAEYQRMVPCPLIHPKEHFCVKQTLQVIRNVFRQSFVIYLPLYLVPALLFRGKSFVYQPKRAAYQLLENTIRSSFFLGCFVSSYQGLSCLVRNMLDKGIIPGLNRDHRFWYWICGFTAAWSILLEKKSRRSELALYVLPRALDIVWQILRDRQYLTVIPYGLEFMFALAMTVNMAVFETERSAMSPFVYKMISVLSGRQGSSE